MRKREDNSGRKKNFQKRIWKRLLALTCVIIMGIADIGTASAMGDSTAGRIMTTGQETEGVTRAERLQETEGVPESETPQEPENSLESEIPRETENGSESEIPRETENGLESEIPRETENGSESEIPWETENRSESEIPWETENGSESETPQEPEGTSAAENPGETETSSEISALQKPAFSEEKKAAAKAPAEPVLKSASVSSYDSVKVKWGAVDDTEGYRVYRKTSETSWKKVVDVDAETTFWEDTGLTCGQKYTYTVRAFVKNGDKYLFSTYNKKGVSAKPVPIAPVLENTVSGDSSVTINWEEVSGATCYYIYRKEPGGKWKRIASVDTPKTSYKDTKASKGVRYIYTVRGMYHDITGKYDADGIEGAAKVQSIILKSISISSGGTAKIKWDKRSGADGYYIYRKEIGGKWKKLKTVSSEKSSWSEKGLDSEKKYLYTVVGYMTLNGKAVKGSVNGEGIAPVLEYTGNYVRNVTKTYLGTSGEGRNMYSYTIGSGKNHIVITMAIHGWEDEWDQDGTALVKTGEQLIRTAAGKTSVLKENDYSIIIITMGNPDGLYSGTTCNGPGRCTTYRYNNNGQLVRGGLDLNRCFPTGFSAQYGTRNYTGDKPLMAREAAVLKSFVDSSQGSGKNIFIDAHGWYNQTITPKSGSGSVYNAFKKYFSGTRSSSLGNGNGYISAYASSQGYDSVLFEFPNISSESQFTKNGYANKYINTIFYMVKNIK